MVKPLFLLKTETIQPINRIARKYASVVANTMLSFVKDSKMTFIHSFTGKRIVNILSSTIFSLSSEIILIFEDGSEHACKGMELVDIYQGKVGAVYAKTKTEEVDYCVALTKLSQFGNNKYLQVDGKFETGYAKRKVFKTMSGAEKALVDLLKSDPKVRGLKIVSSELSN